MPDLFSEEWMRNFMNHWNEEPEISGALEKIGFSSTIAYGFDDDDAPAGVITVENGKVTDAGSYSDQELNWDLRASRDSWEKWLDKGLGKMGLGVAYTSRKLKFRQGDYMAMIKDPRMAGPFVKSFEVMSRV